VGFDRFGNFACECVAGAGVSGFLARCGGDGCGAGGCGSRAEARR
jgi:hypothetical protein